MKPPLIENALHTENVSLIQQELDQSQRYHRHNVDNSNNFLPTRLIDVGDDIRGISPRLVVTDYRLRRRAPRYAALSYCWGSPSDSATQFKTEKETFKDRITGFPLHSMKKVMRDAIVVAKTLSILYLWIDAVCIIQDDQTDWEKESSTMRDIYRYAYVTICTPASASCNMGFLERRRKAISVPFESKICPTVQGSFNLRASGLASPAPYIDEGLDFTFEEMFIPEAKWSKRAWTFQESMLSVRKLYFGSLQLSYSCQDHTRSDTGSSGLPGFGEQGMPHLPNRIEDKVDFGTIY